MKIEEKTNRCSLLLITPFATMHAPSTNNHNENVDEKYVLEYNLNSILTLHDKRFASTTSFTVPNHIGPFVRPLSFKTNYYLLYWKLLKLTWKSSRQFIQKLLRDKNNVIALIIFYSRVFIIRCSVLDAQCS